MLLLLLLMQDVASVASRNNVVVLLELKGSLVVGPQPFHFVMGTKAEDALADKKSRATSRGFGIFVCCAPVFNKGGFFRTSNNHVGFIRPITKGHQVDGWLKFQWCIRSFKIHVLSDET